MTQTPPTRVRPNLHLSLTPFGLSPASSYHSSPVIAPYSPFGTTNYSPFRSAGLRPPLVLFVPRRPKAKAYAWYVIKRYLFSKVIWFVSVFLGLVWWWGGHWNAGTRFMSEGGGIGMGIVKGEITADLRFFPAGNAKIHYVGRWTASPNRLRMDGTFPGVYFDVTVNNTSTLLLSVHNSICTVASTSVGTSTATVVPSATLTPGHLSFHPSSLSHFPAAPISLLARIDQEEYILFPKSSSLVSIRLGDLDPNKSHDVRIIAPMTDDLGRGKVELEGIWLSAGGKLLRVEGSQLAEEFEAEDDLGAGSDSIGKKHRPGSSSSGEAGESEKATKTNDEGERVISDQRKRVLEIVTDSPGSLGGTSGASPGGGGSSLLKGVMGWEYLLGEMFGVDHVSVGTDGMCLIQGCIGGSGQPAGIGDVFFRSGPEGSDYFTHPWTFQSYVPDIMIFNLGGSDKASFEHYGQEYNKTTWELFERFEQTYISLIKAVRLLAYPKHPAAIMSNSNYRGNRAPASIPIFIMRPFRGELEHATQGVVNKLRAEGDRSVFWLDTSGWLDTDDANIEDPDFYLDKAVSPNKWRLTDRGNQRVAIFLHMHVCRFLAQDTEKCSFLPPEVYQGKVYDVDEANLERFLENEKERKLKAFFWQE